jgi:hypothetical protein
MPDPQQRRARNRLARQRTAPARVRARARDDKTIPWVAIGTALGAAAAIGGVVFTGIATYYGAKVAADQLEQSREDSEREERQQAKTFSYWMEEDRKVGLKLHIQNRSPDPIPHAMAYLYGGAEVEKWPSGDRVLKTAVVRLTTTRLAPCTKLTYAVAPFDSSPVPDPASDGGRSTFNWIKFTAKRVEGVRFVDRDGKRWERTSTSLSPSPITFKSPLPVTDLTGFIHVDEPQVHRAAVCDASGDGSSPK